MPLRVCTNFGHQVSNATSLVKGNTGSKFADVLSGTPTIVTTGALRTGSTALELDPSAAVEYIGWSTNTFGASQTRWVANFWIYFPSALPAANVVLSDEGAAAGDIQFEFRNSDDKLILRTVADVQVGPTVVADTWYHIEIYADVSANPWVVKWSVDGTAQTDGGSATAASTLVQVQLGTVDVTQTMTVRYADVCIWSDTAAITGYPFGKHKVEFLKADTGGTTAEIGTANGTSRFTGNATADATHNSANILTAISEVPPLIGASATGVCQRTSGTGNAVGIPMTSYTLASGETISGLRVVIPGWAGTATTNSYGMRTYNGTTETTVIAAENPNFDADTAAPGWWCRMATAADFDTQSELDALVVRLGYSADISPLPGAHAVYAEVAVKEATTTNATVTPPAIATATAMPVPTVVVPTDATVAATAIATSTTLPAPVLPVVAKAITTVSALPAPTIQTGSTVAATSVDTVSTLPAPTVQTGSTVVATTIATVTDVPAPTVSTGGTNATVAATTIVTTTAVPTPTLHTGSTVAAVAVATVAAVPAPTVQTAGNATVSAITIATVSGVPAVTVLAGGNATVTAVTIVTVTALPTPALSTGQRVNPAVVVTAIAVPAPTVSGNVQINVATIATVAVIPVPSFHTGSTISAAVIATVAALAAPFIPEQVTYGTGGASNRPVSSGQARSGAAASGKASGGTASSGRAGRG